MAQAFGALFTPAYKQSTIVMSGLFLVSIILLWAGSIYVPTAVTQLAVRAGNAAPDAARIASYGSFVLAIGTIIGCILVPIFTERIGRRPTMAIFLTVLGVSAAFGFGQIFYLENGLIPFIVSVFFMGIGGANFAVYTIWLPELYSTDCRASAIGFISSVGRFVGVAMVFILGSQNQGVRQPRRAGRGRRGDLRPRSRVATVRPRDEGSRPPSLGCFARRMPGCVERGLQPARWPRCGKSEVESANWKVSFSRPTGHFELTFHLLLSTSHLQ